MILISTVFKDGNYILDAAMPSDAISIVYGLPETTIYQAGDTLPAVATIKYGISISPAQFRLALTRAGLRDQVEAIVATQNQDVKDWYEYANSFESDNALVLKMAAGIGKSAAEVDALFALGLTL